MLEAALSQVQVRKLHKMLELTQKYKITTISAPILATKISVRMKNLNINQNDTQKRQ